MVSTIVLVGPSCAGKGTAGEYLQTKGYQIVLWSDIVRTIVPRLFPKAKKASVFDLADQVRKEFGTTYYAQVIDDVRISKSWKKVVIDGLRHPDEVNYFKKIGFLVLGIDAAYLLREARYIKRNRKGDVTPGGFSVYDMKDRGLLPDRPEFGARVDDCMQLADITINNIGSKKALYFAVSNVIKLL